MVSLAVRHCRVDGERHLEPAHEAERAVVSQQRCVTTPVTTSRVIRRSLQDLLEPGSVEYIVLGLPENGAGGSRPRPFPLRGRRRARPDR